MTDQDRETAHIDAAWLRRFRRNLRRWYTKGGRKLPWRETNDPYRIWISEIMLQQTTVAAVVPYFERFVKAFPDVASLASADENDVLRVWEGLGYYSRARNLHRTARRLAADYKGRLPGEVERLRQLPGIGRYTAGAIASFAFDRPAPIVEANTRRLYSRLIGYRGDPRSAGGQQVLWEFAERILPRKSPGRFNQALMELGATLCRQNDPECAACPVRSCCCAFAESAQQEIPRPPSRRQVTHVTEASVAVRRRGRYLLRRREEGERWAGLWDFQRFELPAEIATDGRLTRSLKSRLRARVLQETGLQVEITRKLTELRHGVTRYRIRLLCFLAEHRAGKAPNGGETAWVPPADFPSYPLSATARKLARLLGRMESW